MTLGLMHDGKRRLYIKYTEKIENAPMEKRPVFSIPSQRIMGSVRFDDGLFFLTSSRFVFHIRLLSVAEFKSFPTFPYSPEFST